MQPAITVGTEPLPRLLKSPSISRLTVNIYRDNTKGALGRSPLDQQRPL